jgi:hypothetical protein
MFTPAALYHPRDPLNSTWQGLAAVCSALGSPSFKLLLFVTRCRDGAEGLDCDLANPSRAMLLQVNCDNRLVAFELPLEDDSVALGPGACVLNSAISPYTLYCKDSSLQPVGSWSAWQCIPERGAELLGRTQAADDLVDGASCVKLAEPQGVLMGLSPCFHMDRFLVRAVGCLDADCDQAVASDDVFELQFEHPSGMRAAQCLKMPSQAGLAAGVITASVVGGAVSVVLGSSVGASVSAATSASSSAASGGAGMATGLVSMLGVGQFMGLTSDMCAVQGNVKWQMFQEIMQAMNCFNLRIPVPAFLTEWSGGFGQLSVCGMYPVDLAAQARGDIGDLFSGNMFFGFILLLILVSTHLLFLQPTSIGWRRFMQKKAPFWRLELHVLVVGVQGSAALQVCRHSAFSTVLMFPCSGVTISSATMIAAQTGGSICKVIGVVALVSVIVFVMFLFFVAFCFVRPSSTRRKVVWSKSEGWEMAVLEHPMKDHLEGLVGSPSRLKCAVAAMASSLNGAWIDRWLPLFESYKGSRGRWSGLILALMFNVALGIILGFGLPLGSCATEQVSDVHACGALVCHRAIGSGPFFIRELCLRCCLCRV